MRLNDDAMFVLLFVVLGALARLLHGCAGTALAPECAPMPDIDHEFAQLVADAEASMVYVAPECASQAQAVEVVESAADMPEVCQRSGTVVGCQASDQHGDSHVWIVKCQRDPRRTIRSERLHALLFCMTGDPDREHVRPVWKDLGL